ncbi:hypothetical protein PoMZ_07461 [Pyricularia oryzae]|uniref:Uncharacterized protein n=1 Tax=Pyricularia oryzae TaxID=318829 RepID=A0A4P7NF69_PYROR|nr:hypothetical protein PoMZ_07461 [Pyricularia oryzae]
MNHTACWKNRDTIQNMVEAGVEASVCVLGLGSRADAQSPHGLRFWSRGFN